MGNTTAIPAEGPALILWNEDGSMGPMEFWEDGEMIEERLSEFQGAAS